MKIKKKVTEKEKQDDLKTKNIKPTTSYATQNHTTHTHHNVQSKMIQTQQ